MHVIADDRERGSGISTYLQEAGIEVTEKRLPVGDYLVNDSLLVERKTLTDLAASIIDSRLFCQCSRLAMSCYKPALLLEGRSGDFKRQGVSRRSIQGALVTVSLFMNIPIIRSASPLESAFLLKTIAGQHDQLLQFGGSIKHHYPARRPKGKYRTQLQLLQSLPGIGVERAQTLLKQFGSVEKALLANEEELSGIHGIGRKTAKKIRWVLEESKGKYRL